LRPTGAKANVFAQQKHRSPNKSSKVSCSIFLLKANMCFE
jgi:hypothetical protein